MIFAKAGLSRRRDHRVFFLEAKIGELYPPEITNPEFYYAFAAVALVRQLGHFVTSTARCAIASSCRWRARETDSSF